MKLAVPLLSLSLLLGCTHAPATDGSTASAKTTAPAHVLPPVDPKTAPLALQLPTFPGGENHDLAKDRGHVVILDVWATWCGPCRFALPAYQSLSDRYGQQGLRVYAISTDESPESLRSFIDEFQLKLPVLSDPEAAVVEPLLQVRLMPTTYFLDRQGRVRVVHEGFDESNLELYEAELQQLLAEGT